MRSIAPDLSSNAVQCTIGSSENISKTNVFVSVINHISGIKSLNDRDKETYYAYVEDSGMKFCNL